MSSTEINRKIYMYHAALVGPVPSRKPRSCHNTNFALTGGAVAVVMTTFDPANDDIINIMTTLGFGSPCTECQCATLPTDMHLAYPFACKCVKYTKVDCFHNFTWFHSFLTFHLVPNWIRRHKSIRQGGISWNYPVLKADVKGCVLSPNN